NRRRRPTRRSRRPPASCAGKERGSCWEASRPGSAGWPPPRACTINSECPCFWTATPRACRGGRGRFQPQVVPYFPEAALALLAPVRHMILVDAKEPISFFAYPNTPSYLLPEDCTVFTLAPRGEDGAAALEALADDFGAPEPALEKGGPPPVPPDGPLTADTVGAIVAARVPPGCIISDEMVSSGGAVLPHLRDAEP